MNRDDYVAWELERLRRRARARACGVGEDDLDWRDDKVGESPPLPTGTSRAPDLRAVLELVDR